MILALIFLFVASLLVFIYINERGSYGYSVNGKEMPGFLYYLTILLLVIIYLSLISH